MMIMTYLIITIVVALVVWRATRVVRWWLEPAELPEPEPRRPFLSELEERRLERQLGIGLPVPVHGVSLPNVPNIKRADGSPCYEVTRDDVVAYATELIAMGQARDVKAALEDLMVNRVSQLEDDQLAAFVLRLQEYAGMSEEDLDDLDDGPF